VWGSSDCQCDLSHSTITSTITKNTNTNIITIEYHNFDRNAQKKERPDQELLPPTTSKK